MALARGGSPPEAGLSSVIRTRPAVDRAPQEQEDVGTMKRMLALVLLSVSLSIAATLLATWASFTFRAHRRVETEPPEETIPA